MKKPTQQQVMQKIAQMEQNCVVSALKEYLKRNVNQNDIQKCGRIPHPKLKDRYILTYNKKRLGMVKQMLKGKDYSVEFTGGEITF